MATFLMPPARQRGWTNNGVPAAGCLLYTYEAGTTTPKATYTDAAGTIPHTNPIVLDAKGEALIYWSGNYKVDLKTAAGVQITGYPVDNYQAPLMSGDISVATGSSLISGTWFGGVVAAVSALAASTGSALIGFLQASGTARSLQSKLRDVYNTKDYGATAASSAAANKIALQAAITAVNAAGGGRVVNDFDINYGLNFRDLATYPSFTGMTTDIVVEDYANGTADGTNKLGAQGRVFSYTNQTSPVGQHDGNFLTVNAGWAPGLGVNNTMNLAAVGDPSRLATDNRRAFFAVYNDGICTWQNGQGTRVGAGLTDEEMSNYCIQKFNNTGDTLTDYTSLLIERKTGNMSYGGGRNIPAAHHHFEAVTSSPTLNTAMFESKATTCSITMRNSTGAADDVELRNVAGDIALHVTGVGNALIALKANRYIGIGTNAPTYPLHVTKAIASDYVALFENTSATNGFGPKVVSSTAAGIGFDLLELYSDAGADIKFRFRGDGAGTCDGAWTGGGADRAEAMEWADGNPTGIDGDKAMVGSNRVGHTVTMDNGKIKIAQPGDLVIGVVSLTYDSLGNANPLNWGKKYLRDDFGLLLYEDYEVVEWTEHALRKEATELEPARYERVDHSYPDDAVPAGLTIPGDATRTLMKRPKLNPDFNPAQTYSSRIERKEWDPIGVLGICRVRKGQVMGANWIKMRDISATVEEWLVR